MKAAIFHGYDISEETYRQRFRDAKRKDGEAYKAIAMRLHDLVKKWMTGCTTVEVISEKIVTERLLNTMPTDLCIWIRERKPATGEEAGTLTDDYMLAR